MNGIRLLAVTLLLAGISLAEDKKPDDKVVKQELKKLEGAWKAISAEMGGKAVTPTSVGMDKVRIKGNKMTFFAEDKEVATLEIKVVPSKKPKHMDWIKDRKYKPLPCLYELKGDELRICFPLLPKKGSKTKVDVKRPEGFQTKDRPLGLIVLKREKT
jgi:uncharacterized protein (TIGR03067 family)